MSPPIINSGLDTVWMTLTTHLMFLMQLGFAFIEAGTVRYKSINPILLKNVLDTGVVTTSWYLIGYCFAFGDSVGGIIGMSPELIAYSAIDESNYENNYYTHIVF
jgi:Amt family ammonium transporter